MEVERAQQNIINSMIGQLRFWCVYTCDARNVPEPGLSPDIFPEGP